MRLLPVSTGLLITVTVSLWPAAILAAAPDRTLADLRAAAVAATILAGVAAAAWRVVHEFERCERHHRADKNILIRAMDRQLNTRDHPSGPFSVVP